MVAIFSKADGWKALEASPRAPVRVLGVFVSHSRLDKEKAREVAHALQASKVDYYFDENDAELQLADEQGDHLKVVQCIENGLSVCTHLLGIITENTKDSWWVPYEIGSATGRAQDCAHLIDEEVTKLPSYIQAARILANREEMRAWLPSENTKTASASNFIVELSKALAVACDYPSFIPTSRQVSELTFYSKPLCYGPNSLSSIQAVTKRCSMPRSSSDGVERIGVLPTMTKKLRRNSMCKWFRGSPRSASAISMAWRRLR